MKTILIILTFLICCSCNRKDSDRFSPGDSPEPAEITISAGKETFKETGIENEDYIHDLNVYVIDSEAGIFIQKFQKGSRIQVEVPYTDFSVYEIYAIANLGKELKFRSKEQLLNGEYTIENAEDLGKESGLAIMSGKGTVKDIYNGKNVYIDMVRIISKINVNIVTSGLNEDVRIQIDSISICNMNCTTPFFRSGHAENGDRTVRSDGVILNKRFCSLYVMENMQGDLLPGITDQKMKVFSEGDPRAERCTYLKIRGNYLSDAHSGNINYRIYIGKNTLDNFDVERNHSYNVTVNFTGTGINEVSWRIDTTELIDHVTALSISPKEHTFSSYKKNKQFQCSVFPPTAIDKSISWYSSDAGVCFVKPDGTAIPRGHGTCTIYAVSNDRNQVKDSAIVTCSEKIDILDVLIYPRIQTISLGQTLQMDYICNPPNATRPEEAPVWSSNLPFVLFIKDGLLQPRKLGRATIFLEVKSNGQTFKDQMEIRVVKEYMTISELPVLYPGCTYYIKVNSSIPNIKPTFSSSNTRIASISSKGEITAHSTGMTVISAKYGELTATQTLTIKEPRLELDKSDLSIGVDTYGKISVTRTEPFEAPVQWSIDNPYIATLEVLDKGMTCMLKGVKHGNTVLHATMNYAEGYSVTKDIPIEVSYAPMADAQVRLIHAQGRYDRNDPDRLVDSHYTFGDNCFKVYGIEIFPATANPDFSVKWTVTADNGEDAADYVESTVSSDRNFLVKAKEFPNQGLYRPKRGMVTLTAEISNTSGESFTVKKHLSIYEFLPIVPKPKQPVGAEIDFSHFHFNHLSGYFVLNLLKDSQPYFWPEKIENGPTGCWIFPIKSEMGYEISECLQTNTSEFKVLSPLGSGAAFENFVHSLSVHKDYHYDDNIFVYVDIVYPYPVR